jgi:hypothetical protein
MYRHTPRGIQLIRAAVADLEDLGELAKLEALLGRRAAEFGARPGAQLPLALDDDTSTYQGIEHDAG